MNAEEMPSLNPRFEIRQQQYYAAIRARTSRRNLAIEAPKVIAEVAKWLAKNRIAPGGPPLIRYLSIGNDETVDVEIGIGTSEPAGGGKVIGASLPRGRYLTTVHTGPYDRLVDTTAALLEWASQHGVAWDNQAGPTGTVWKSRVEHYLTDPEEQPDPERWETRLAFLTRG
jgi:effector-binding domain-containing protein